MRAYKSFNIFLFENYLLIILVVISKVINEVSKFSKTHHRDISGMLNTIVISKVIIEISKFSKTHHCQHHFLLKLSNDIISTLVNQDF